MGIMTLRLVQFTDTNGSCGVALLKGESGAVRVSGVTTTYELVRTALRDGISLAAAAEVRAGEPVDLATAEAEGRLLAPIEHPDPAHCHLTGTGLTHLGSAEGRDQMHKAAAGGSLTDSMRM